jgi:hypothetical protein
MKLTLTLTLLLLTLIACDKNKTGDDKNKSVAITEINASNAEDFAATFETDETNITEDASTSFDANNAFTNIIATDASRNKANSKTYDSIGGFWLFSKDFTTSRTDTLITSNKTIIRNKSIVYSGSLKSFLRTSAGAFVKLPNLKADNIDTIRMLRNLTINTSADVTIKKNGSTDLIFKDKTKDESANNSVILSRVPESSTNWNLSLSGSKALTLEIVRNDTTLSYTSNSTLTSSGLVVKKVKKTLKHSANFISGTLTRTIIQNSHTFVIETTFYEPTAENSYKRSKRVFKRDGVIFKTIDNYSKMPS